MSINSDIKDHIVGGIQHRPVALSANPRRLAEELITNFQDYIKSNNSIRLDSNFHISCDVYSPTHTDSLKDRRPLPKIGAAWKMSETDNWRIQIPAGYKLQCGRSAFQDKCLLVALSVGKNLALAEHEWGICSKQYKSMLRKM